MRNPDYHEAVQLVVVEYRKLDSINPNHELLRYICKVTDDDFMFVSRKYSAFLKRFETPEDKLNPCVNVEKVLTAYSAALRAAFENRWSKREPQKRTEPATSLEKV